MNRLTEKDNQGNWCLKGLPWKCLRLGEVITTTVHDRLYGALCKLMKYEDTGLSPEDVERLNDFEQSQITDLLKKLAEERRKHRWITVEERLPEPDEMVLIQVSGKPVENVTLHEALQLAEYNQEEGWILEAWPEWEEASPVAWMSLPEKYRPED